MGFENLYKPIESTEKLWYQIDKLKESGVLGQFKKENVQSFGDFVDSEIFLPLLKADLSKIEKNEVKETPEILTQKEQIENPEENENSDPDPNPEEKQKEGPSYKYFMDPTIENEKNFKFRVNKALKQSRRLKEMICLEQTLQGSDERNGQIIKEFTSNMADFDKNVVLASLGKKFEAGLSEELRKITEEARKELLAIQGNFSQYKKANENIQEEINNEEEDSQYEDLDYDFQFGANGEEKEEEEQEESDKEEAPEDEISPENSEKISKLLNSFEFDDDFIMSVFELFFCYFNPLSKNEGTIAEFLKNSISLNPANELKVIDTMITILYTPEFFGYYFNGKTQDDYERAVDKILAYFSKYYQETNRNYIFFVPKTYLENFGNKILKNVKEETKFAERASDCHTVLDMILNLIDTPSFCRNDRWIVKIVEGFMLLMSKEKDIKLGESLSSQTDQYKKIIPCKRLLSLLTLIEKPIASNISQFSLKIQELFMSLTSMPKLFVPLHDDLSNHFYQTIVKMNTEIEQSLLALKQNQNEEEVLSHLNVAKFELILIILFTFAGVFHENLLTAKGNKSKASKRLEPLLKSVTGSLFNEEQVKLFFVNIHELSNTIEPKDDSPVLVYALLICIGHYSIIMMENTMQEGLGRQTGDSETGAFEVKPLEKSFSDYRKDSNVDFEAIFANFALKQSSQISGLLFRQKKGLLTLLNDFISMAISKFPWIIDLKSKMRLFKGKFDDHLEENNIEPEDFRAVKVSRENIVFSTMKLFESSTKEELLQESEVIFHNEEGADGGGLRRDFYELISKELFDPCVGLFKLTPNQISIQPNPLSSIVPYDSTLMQFAGIILAKGISEGCVLNVNFTKSFLKHLLDRKITIADLEEIDADLGKNLQWILDNDIEDLCLTYTHEIEVLGERTVVELKDGGSDIFVDEENKKEYVEQICEYRMTEQIKKQLDEFLKGFRMVLPKDLLSHFSISEFGILIAGESKIDLEDMKKHAQYEGYSPSDQVIQWFWEVLEEFSQDQLTAFYYFISGSSRVPFGGFKGRPMGIMKYSIDNALPIGHTCAYRIELPNYDSKDKLREKLLFSIFDGAGEFQIG